MRLRSTAPMRTAKVGYIVMSLALCAFGIVLIVLPDISAKILGIICGVIAAAFGCVRLVGYFSKDLYRLAFQYDLASGALITALGVIMLLLLVPLYMLAQRRRCSLRDVLPGILLSLAAWMILSAAFSYYVEKVAHYSMLYGSIATIVVVLLWLYMSGMVLILGAEFNGVLLSHREKRKQAETEETQA